MKSFFNIALFIGAGLLLFSCHTSKSAVSSKGSSPEQIAVAWEAAKDDFHGVMASTFHPAQEDNLAPVKAKYQELADISSKWAALPLPQNEQGKGLDKLLKKLSTESKTIGKVVNKGNDEAIKNAIFGLHDVFHKIVGLCDH